MSRFFVGQRVRLVVSAKYAGTTGVITAIGSWVAGEKLPCGYWLGNGVADCCVQWDRMVTTNGTGSRLFSVTPCTTDRLEPILPDGHRACDDEFKRDLDKLLEGLPA